MTTPKQAAKLIRKNAKPVTGVFRRDGGGRGFLTYATAVAEEFAHTPSFIPHAQTWTPEVANLVADLLAAGNTPEAVALAAVIGGDAES